MAAPLYFNARPIVEPSDGNLHVRLRYRVGDEETETPVIITRHASYHLAQALLSGLVEIEEHEEDRIVPFTQNVNRT